MVGGTPDAPSAPELPAKTDRTVLRVRRDSWAFRRDEVATEWPLTVVVNGLEFVTLVVTPTHLDELVVGFLHSEGVVERLEDILEMRFDEAQGRADVRVAGDAARAKEAMFARRYVTSCCGKGRLSVYFDVDRRTVRSVGEGPRLTPEDVHRLVEQLQEGSALFRETGGVHNACLARSEGLVALRSDIGRHNALDKLYGYALLHRETVEDKVVAFSGRVSSEVLLKVAKIGVSTVLSKSAPTELALALAEELNITVVGFVRRDELNVYTHPERIVLPA